MEIDHLLDASEAAILLRMGNAKVLRLAKAGGIPCVVLPDGEYRFDRSDLASWIAAHKRPTTSGQERTHGGS
jgi:excisionase family DNA binding protein